MASFTQDEILAQLDTGAGMFPPLENENVYLGDVRLNAYADETRWAMQIEFLGVTFLGWCREGAIHNWIYHWGNCVTGRIGIQDSDLHCVTQEGDDGPPYENNIRKDYWYVRPDLRSIRIRGVVVPVDLSQTALAAKGIQLTEPPRLTAPDLLMSLLPEYREMLLATETELRQRLPTDLPRILRLNEWRHPENLSYTLRYDPRFPPDQFPSMAEAFQMIADVLVTRDPSRYQPTLLPNTPWDYSEDT